MLSLLSKLVVYGGLILSTIPPIFPPAILGILSVFLIKKSARTYLSFFLTLSVAPIFLYSANTNKSVLTLFVFVVYSFFGTQFKLSRKGILFASYIAFASISAQFLFSFLGGQSRPVLVGYEQNFTALTCFYPYLILSPSKKRFLFVLLGGLTIGRAFFMCVMLHEFLRLKFVKKVFTRQVFFLSVLSILTAFILGNAFVLTLSTFQSYDPSFSRLFNLFDSSTYIRAITNLEYLNIIFSSDYIFSGVSSDVYSQELMGQYTVAHNTFLQIGILYGLLVLFIYSLSVIWLFSQNPETRVGFLSLLPYSFALHSVLLPFFLILLHICWTHKISQLDR